MERIRLGNRYVGYYGGGVGDGILWCGSYGLGYGFLWYGVGGLYCWVAFLANLK